MKAHNIKASFFLTGRFYRSPLFKPTIQQLKKDGHYLGAHSDAHLLYCDWVKRDSLLVTRQQFTKDLFHNYKAMRSFGVSQKDAAYFLPPYEWYNDSIAAWTEALGLQLINYTPGTLSHADYTIPDAKNYRSSAVIKKSIQDLEAQRPAGLKGFILLLHIGTDPKRTDKFYYQLPMLLKWLHTKGYQPVKINELLAPFPN